MKEAKSRTTGCQLHIRVHLSTLPGHTCRSIHMADSSPNIPFDQSTFDRLPRERPWQLLDRHPDGLHAAMQVIVVLETTVERAAVWDVETGRIVWAPEGVSALAWL